MKTMKGKVLTTLVLAAVIAIIGFSFVACSDGGGGGGSGGSGGGGSGGEGEGGGYSASRGGTFTLTDIPAEYNGKYANFQNSPFASLWIRGSEKAGTSGIDQNPIPISNGSVSIPLWYDTKTQTGYIGYTGTETIDGCSVNIFSEKAFDSTKVIKYASTFSVTFSNGNATRSWNELTWNDRP